MCHDVDVDETHDERWTRLRRSRREQDPSGELAERAVARMRSLTGEAVAGSPRDVEEIRLLAIEAVKPEAEKPEAEAEVEQPSRPADGSGLSTIGVVAFLAGLIAPFLLLSGKSNVPFFPSAIAIVLTGSLIGVSALLFLVLAVRKRKPRLFNSRIYGTFVVVWIIGVLGTVGRAAGVNETVERPVDGSFLLLPHVAGSLLIQVAAIATVGWLWTRAPRIQRASRSESDLSGSDAFSEEQRAAALAAEIEGIRLWARTGEPSDDAVSAALASAFDRWAPARQ